MMFIIMEAVRTSETSVDNHFTRQYNPEDSSEHQRKHICSLSLIQAPTAYMEITQLTKRCVWLPAIRGSLKH
jgi:hypothetical protein